MFTDQALNTTQFWVAGYPSEPAKAEGTMWAHQGPVTPKPAFLEYTTDTSEGESGAPVFVKAPDGYWAGGIHVGGVAGTGNRAVRITGTVFDELDSWKDGW